MEREDRKSIENRLRFLDTKLALYPPFTIPLGKLFQIFLFFAEIKYKFQDICEKCPRIEDVCVIFTKKPHFGKIIL